MRTLILILFTMTTVSYAQTPPIEPGVSHELAKWRAAHYSNVRYKIDLTLEKMSPVLKGTIEVRVRVRDAVSERRGDAAIILDWRKIKGFEAKSTISNVAVNGRDVRVTHSGVSPASKITPQAVTLTYEESNEHLIFRNGVVGGENIIKLDFTSPILPSGSAITRYVDKEDGAEYIYSLFVPSDASTAFPVFDQPDLKARFSLNIIAPIDWNVVSNSWLFHENSNENVSPAAVEALKRKAEKKYEDDKAKGYPHPFEGIEHSALASSIPPAGFKWTYFNETKPISTYVFAFAAGPWQQVSEPGAVATGSPREGAPTKGNPVAIARGSDSGRNIYVRRSQLAKFKPHAAEIFRLNREGIKFLEQYFDYRFPFPKYDIVLIPEFPFGGMEHAGATFLREDRVIFPQEPTKNDYITRANVIFHEAAHQWFGDTVTMRWFDDLWLKEGFAEFMAYKTLEKVMPEYNVWKVFYERNKQSAYLTDSTKGTTPIYQEIKNLSAAKSAYGNIVYRKAPSFLKQAEFYIGADKFRTAVRAFLKKHEFSNAGWEDLVKEFENSSGTDLTSFAEAWVKRPGMPILRVTSKVDGCIETTSITQTGTLGNGYWGMRIAPVVVFGGRGKTRNLKKEILLSKKTEILDWQNICNALEMPVATFPNYADHGYGIFLLENKSRDHVLRNIDDEKDDFLRSMMWGSLWDSVREGELDPKEYVELVIKNVGVEKDELTIQTNLGRVSTAMTYYRSEPVAIATGSPRGFDGTKGNRVATAPGSDLSERLESMLIDKMSTAPTLGQRITYYRALLNVVSTEAARSVLKRMLRESVPPASAGGSGSASRDPSAHADGTDAGRRGPADDTIPLKTKDRFDIVTRLLILNDPDAPKLLAELEKTETSDEAKRYAYAARAGIATAENKAKYWTDFTANKEISESWIEAAFGPFNSVRHTELTLPYLERALKELPNHKRTRKIFFVNGWLAAFIGGHKSEEALAIVNKFLADNPGLDRDLRLKILENVDLIERAIKIRTKYR